MPTESVEKTLYLPRSVKKVVAGMGIPSVLGCYTQARMSCQLRAAGSRVTIYHSDLCRPEHQHARPNKGSVQSVISCPTGADRSRHSSYSRGESCLLSDGFDIIFPIRLAHALLYGIAYARFHSTESTPDLHD